MGFIIKGTNSCSSSRFTSNSKFRNANNSKFKGFVLSKEDLKWKDATKRERKQVVINAYKDFAF